MIAAGGVLAGRKVTSNHRRDPQRRKKLGRRLQPGDALRRPRSCQVPADILVDGEIGELGAMLEPVFESAAGHTAIGPAIRHRFHDIHELFGMRIRQWLEQRRVDHAEDGGVGADAERERDHGDSSEAGGLGERAESEAHVAPKFLQPRQAAGVAVRFTGLIDAAESNARLTSRHLRCHAGADIVRGGGFKVLGQLCVEVGIERGLGEDGPESRQPAINRRVHGAGAPPGAVRMRSTTPDMRCQFWVSASRRCRPRTVI